MPNGSGMEGRAFLWGPECSVARVLSPTYQPEVASASVGPKQVTVSPWPLGPRLDPHPIPGAPFPARKTVNQDLGSAVPLNHGNSRF